MDRNDNNTIALGIIALVAVMFVGVFGLAALGRDITQVVYFIGPSVVAILGILAAILRVNVVEKKTDEQTSKLDTISKAVNGQLEKKFQDVHAAINDTRSTIQGQINQVQLAQGLTEPAADPAKAAPPVVHKPRARATHKKGTV